MHNYKTKGTCSTKIHFCINKGKIHNLSFENGCDGNLKALSALAEGMEAAELVTRLKGIRCGSKKTSCGDQLAQAVQSAINELHKPVLT